MPGKLTAVDNSGGKVWTSYPQNAQDRFFGRDQGLGSQTGKNGASAILARFRGMEFYTGIASFLISGMSFAEGQISPFWCDSREEREGTIRDKNNTRKSFPGVCLTRAKAPKGNGPREQEKRE